MTQDPDFRPQGARPEAPGNGPKANKGNPRGFPAGTTAEDGICWVCGGETIYRHCRIVCSNCGFTRDCSDP